MPKATMMRSAALPPDVLAFAAEQNVVAYLPPMLETTERLFPSAGQPTIRVDEDPEIANDRHIVFEVGVRLGVLEALDAQRRWNDALFACCPAPLVSVFRLSMDLVAG